MGILRARGMYTVEFLPLETSEPGRFPLTSAASRTGRSDRIAFYSSVQLFLLFTVSKLSCDRYYRAPRVSKVSARSQFARIPKPSAAQHLRLSPFAATHPRNVPVTPLAATHTKSSRRKSFPCHTCKIEGVWGQLWLTSPGSQSACCGQLCFCEEETMG